MSFHVDSSVIVEIGHVACFVTLGVGDLEVGNVMFQRIRDNDTVQMPDHGDKVIQTMMLMRICS